jgi:AraC family transcriptional regulator, arabinose operon regulatory protein
LFNITNGGIDSRHPANFILTNHGISDFSLVLVKTNAHFVIGDQQEVDVFKNSVILIDENTPYRYCNKEGNYIDDWLYFKCEDTSWIHPIKKIANRICLIPDITNFSNYIKLILWEKEFASDEYKIENTTLLLKVLLNNLLAINSEKEGKHFNNPHYFNFQKLRLQIQSQPEVKYCPENLAHEFSISLSHFQHLYKEFFGISLQKDIINCRIERAKRLLATSNLTIEQISEICGYNNEVHFYRQFKKKVDTSPKQFSKNKQNGKVMTDLY